MHRSFWLEQALAGTADDPNSLRGTVTSDVAIVGGGFVGLWTALMIKRRDPVVDVCIVEADVCGAGASGRCGGFVMTWWPKIVSLRTLLGADEALRLVKASEAAIDEIENFCSEHAPEAEFRRGGWLWTATTERNLAHGMRWSPAPRPWRPVPSADQIPEKSPAARVRHSTSPE